MCSESSAIKTRDELLRLGKADLEGLVDLTLELQAHVQHLLDRIAQNSSNSSRPPSTDQDRPKPKSLGTKSGRKPGAQPGHKGKRLELKEDPNHIKIHPLLKCECGQDLSKEPAVDFERRQVFDLPCLTLECTEHRVEIKDCPCCGMHSRAAFPDDVRAPAQYGKNFRVLLAYLYDAQIGASRRIRQMGAEMFGYAVSEGTIQRARQEHYRSLEPFEERLEQILPQEPVLHADETMIRIGKTKHWVHVLCTPMLTFLNVQLLRGKEAINAIGIIPQFTGWLMHDFLSSYLGFQGCLHTFCKSHLMRELVFIFEQHHQPWANDLHDLFLEMLHDVQQRRARDAPLSEEQFECWKKRYWKILHAGRRANPSTPEQQAQKRPKQSKEQNLLDRLEGYDDCILAFQWHPELPFTNNEAERDLRMTKVRVKVSGCFRTLDGARRHARIRSYISTLRKHDLPVLEYLRRAIDGDPFLPSASPST